MDVMNTRSTINTSHWREFDSLSFTLVSDDCYPLLSDLILGMPSLTRLQLFNASDRGLQTIFATLQQVSSRLSGEILTRAGAFAHLLFLLCTSAPPSGPTNLHPWSQLSFSYAVGPPITTIATTTARWVL